MSKDEEKNLAACLQPISGLVDEIVVVDTGSTDRTLEIALSFGARVVDFPWVDDFAAARNEGLRHATGEWIFWLDADDRLDEENVRRLQRLFGMLSEKNYVYMMKQWSVPDHVTGSALVVDHARLFRRQPGVCWRYRVHEQILPALREAGAKIVWTDIVIRHLGYQETSVRKRKLERNLRPLQREHEERPDEAFTLFNLAGTYLDLGDFERAIPYLQRCLETAPAGATFLPKAYVLLTQCQRALGHIEEGLRYCREGKSHYPNDVELWFEEGLLCQARKDAAGAQQAFECKLRLPPQPCYVGVDVGLRGHLTRHNLALAYREQGRLSDAASQWRAAVQECPHFGPAWLGLAEACLVQGQTAEVEGMIERLSQEPGGSSVVPVLRARVCRSRGDTLTARRILEEAIAQAPHFIWLRLLLSDVLLREGKDLDEAERQLQEVLATDPKQKQARHRLQQIQERKQATTQAL